jgi:hypothetical protein
VRLRPSPEIACGRSLESTPQFLKNWLSFEERTFQWPRWNLWARHALLGFSSSQDFILRQKCIFHDLLRCMFPNLHNIVITIRAVKLPWNVFRGKTYSVQIPSDSSTKSRGFGFRKFHQHRTAPHSGCLLRLMLDFVSQLGCNCSSNALTIFVQGQYHHELWEQCHWKDC